MCGAHSSRELSSSSRSDRFVTVVLANRAARPFAVRFNGLRTFRFGSGGSTAGRSRAALQRVGNGPALDRRFVDTPPERWIIRIARFTLLAVRNDDAPRPAPESRRFGPTPAAGSTVALECLSPMPSACDSDDNIPEILKSAGTGFVEDDHVIQAFAADRTDHTFDIRSLPR
jgi:hypothetical protein